MRTWVVFAMMGAVLHGCDRGDVRDDDDAGPGRDTRVAAWVVPNDSIEVAAVAAHLGPDDHVLLLDQQGHASADPEMLASFIRRERTPRVERVVLSPGVPETLAEALRAALGSFPVATLRDVQEDLATDARASGSGLEVIWVVSAAWAPHAAAMAATRSARGYPVAVTSRSDVLEGLIADGMIAAVTAFGSTPPVSLPAGTALTTIGDQVAAASLLVAEYGPVPEMVAAVFTGADRAGDWPFDFFSSAPLAAAYAATRVRAGYGVVPVSIESRPHVDYDARYLEYDAEIADRLGAIPELTALALVSHWMDVPYARSFLMHQPGVWGEVATSIANGLGEAADGEYADLDGDMLPDLPFSRLAGHTPAQASLLAASGLDLLRGTADRAGGFALLGGPEAQEQLEALYPGAGSRRTCYYEDGVGEPYSWDFIDALDVAATRDHGEIVFVGGHNVCDPRDDAQELEFGEPCDAAYVPPECDPSPPGSFVQTHLLMSSDAIWTHPEPPSWASFWFVSASGLGTYNPLENEAETSFPRALARWGAAHMTAGVGHNVTPDCPTPPEPSCFDEYQAAGDILANMDRPSVRRRPAWAMQLGIREGIARAREEFAWDEDDGIVGILLGDPLAGYAGGNP